jgi:hypothetical protein
MCTTPDQRIVLKFFPMKHTSKAASRYRFPGTCYLGHEALATTPREKKTKEPIIKAIERCTEDWDIFVIL